MRSAIRLARFLTAIAAGLLSAAPAVAAPRFSTRSQISAGLKEKGLAGAVWSTLSPDGSIATGAAGLRNARSGAPLKPDDKVQVGSITKALVATGVLRLVSEGRLRLDTPVAKLLPGLRVDNPWAADSPLLLRHLLDHTSGLDDARLWQVFSLKASPDVPLGEAIPPSLEIRRRPGSTFSYSNTGYTLLGMVIEKLVGERYEPYLDRTLLAPLGMTNSSFAFVTQARDPSLAMGHFENGVPHPAATLYARPASQFTTTAHDMALFARFLLGNGRIDGRPFIAPALMRARGWPAGTDAARARLNVGYGLGLSRQERGGALGFCHGGDTVGYRAMLCIFPEQRKAFFRSINADVEGADYKWIDAMLVNALAIPKPQPMPPAPMPADIAEWEGVYVASPARFETFAYLDQVLNFVRVARDEGRLTMKPFQGKARTLTPVGGRLFRADDRSTASHVLVIDRDGERVLSNEFLSLRKISLWRITPLWLSLAVGLLGLGYVFVAGLVGAAKRSLGWRRPLFFPFLALLALAVPVPLFMTQSFLAMGDLTPASGALALVTGLLPLAMVFGLARRFRIGIGGWPARLEAIAMGAVLQWTAVLMAWGMLPFMLWR